MSRSIQRLLLCSMAVPWPDNPRLCAFHLDQANALADLGVTMQLFSPVLKMPRAMRRLHRRLRGQVDRPHRYEMHGITIESPPCWWAFPPVVRHHCATRFPDQVARFARTTMRRALLRTIDRMRPDVLIGHGMMPWGLLLQSIAQETGIPFAIIEHSAGDVLRLRPGSALAEHYVRVAAAAERIFVVGVGMQQHLEWLAVRNVCRLDNGARLPEPDQLRNPRPRQLRCRTIVLSAANYYRRKGFEELVAAFQRVAQQQADAMLVLITNASAGLLRQVAATGLADRICILPAMNQADLLQWMVWADLFAMPSSLEAFGLVYVEAMACGTPVLMSADCGLAPLLDLAASKPGPAQHGWQVAPRCVEATERALREALADPERLAAMGRAAQGFATARFTWRENAMQMLAALGDPRATTSAAAPELACR